MWIAEITTNIACKLMQNPVYLMFAGFFVFDAFLQFWPYVITEL